MQGRIKNWLINYLTGNLLKAVSEEDILRITNKGFFINKRKLTPEEIATLKDEADSLSNSFLWKIMTKDVEFMAFLQMSKQATKPDDIIFGKAMFYSLKILRDYLERLKTL